MLDQLLIGQPKTMMKNAVKISLIAAGSILGTTLIHNTIAMMEARIRFPLRAAEIGQLRHDLSKVPCAQAQQVIAQVVSLNMEIANNHQQNRTWYLDPILSDGWNELQPIPIPCE